jgi:hypothetical protein
MLDRATITRQREGGELRKPPRSDFPPLWLPPPADGRVCHPRAASQISRSWLEPVRLDYTVSAGRLAVVRLLAELDAAFGPPSPAWLVVRRAELRSRHAPFASETVIDRMLLWQVSFRLPLELVEYPHALFDLEARDGVAIALPAPALWADAAAADRELKPRIRPLLRRSAVGFATCLAVAAVSNSIVAVASAASAPTQTAKNGVAAYAPQAATAISPTTSSPSTKTTVTTTFTTVTTTTVSQTPAGALGGTTKSDLEHPAVCVLTATAPGSARASKTGNQPPRHATGTTCAVPPQDEEDEEEEEGAQARAGRPHDSDAAAKRRRGVGDGAGAIVASPWNPRQNPS